MTRMLVIAGATALALLNSPVVAPAQEQGGASSQGQSAGRAPEDMPAQGQSAGRTSEDRPGAVDRGLARFKEALRLTPEQERNWSAFESAVREVVKLRLEGVAERRDQAEEGNPTERLRRVAERLGRMSAALGRLADATGPLYGALDEGQRERFGRLASLLRERVAMLAERMRDRGYGMRDDRSFEQRGGRDGYRFGEDDSDDRRWQRDGMDSRDLRRMYRDMRRMYGEMMRHHGDYGDRRGWRDREDRWSERDEGRNFYGRRWGNRDRYGDDDR